MKTLSQGTRQLRRRTQALMADEEWVDLVDLDNRIVGAAPRAEVRRRNLLHRGIGIMCLNGRGDVYVHKRTDTKDVFPGMYDMFVGGVVGRGETYEQAALRELEEELGVRGAELRHLFMHLYQGDANRSWIMVFDVRWDGPIVHQPEEVAWGAWMPEERLEAWAREVPVVPDGLGVFEHWLAWKRADGETG